MKTTRQKQQAGKSTPEFLMDPIVQWDRRKLKVALENRLAKDAKNKNLDKATVERQRKFALLVFTNRKAMALDAIKADDFVSGIKLTEELSQAQQALFGVIHRDVILNRGCLHLFSGQYNKAILDFETTLAYCERDMNDPDHKSVSVTATKVQAMCFKAMALSRMGADTEAMVIAESAVGVTAGIDAAQEKHIAMEWGLIPSDYLPSYLFAHYTVLHILVEQLNRIEGGRLGKKFDAYYQSIIDEYGEPENWHVLLRMIVCGSAAWRNTGRIEIGRVQEALYFEASGNVLQYTYRRVEALVVDRFKVNTVIRLLLVGISGFIMGASGVYMAVKNFLPEANDQKHTRQDSKGDSTLSGYNTGQVVNYSHFASVTGGVSTIKMCYAANTVKSNVRPPLKPQGIVKHNISEEPYPLLLALSPTGGGSTIKMGADGG